MHCFLVLGPESAGTRFFTRCLLSAGCFGDQGHEQRLDRGFDGAGPTIVWRRSFPHYRTWPDADAMLDQLRAAGYDQVSVFHLSRRLDCCARSQVAAGHVATEAEAIDNIQRAHQLIGQFIDRHRLPFQSVQYEQIIADPAWLKIMLGIWGLTLPALPTVIDANAKWLTLQALDSKSAASGTRG